MALLRAVHTLNNEEVPSSKVIILKSQTSKTMPSSKYFETSPAVQKNSTCPL
jgi:hypothetical protein